MLSEAADWSISNIKGELAALLILYILAVLGVFAIGATFRGHIQI